MMNDTLRPKHHINPLAQYDSLKDAAAVSPPLYAQGKIRVHGEEEDTDYEAQETRLAVGAPESGEERTEQNREKRSLEREEHKRTALERTERMESREGQTWNKVAGEKIQRVQQETTDSWPVQSPFRHTETQTILG